LLNFFICITGEDEKEKKRRLKAEEAVKKWEDHKEVDSVKSKKKFILATF